MSDPLQSKARADRSRTYFRMFWLTATLTLVGIIFWPLELDVYSDPTGKVIWLWNDEPAVSTETANFWRHASLQPLLYFSILLAMVSFALYKREKKKSA